MIIEDPATGKNTKIGLESETQHGIVKHIFGEADDHIVFKNEYDQLKVIARRDDDVYRKAQDMSKSFSAKEQELFFGVYKIELDAILPLCLSSSLKQGVKVADLKEIFKPAEDLIKSRTTIIK